MEPDMSHEITTLDTMISTGGRAPWHIGDTRDRSFVVPGVALDPVAVLSPEYGLDWQPVKLPAAVVLPSGQAIEARFPDGSAVYNVVRSNTGHVLNAGVTDAYQPYTMADACQLLARVVETGWARQHKLGVHTAGSLAGGMRQWILAAFGDGSEPVPGDRIVDYVMLSLGHDGRAVKALHTPVRVVCANTERVALGAAASATLKVVHRANVRDGVEDALRTLGHVVKASATYHETLRRAAQVQLTDADAQAYADAVYPVPPPVEDKRVHAPAPRQHVNERRQAEWRRLFEGAATGADLAGRTLYGAHMATTERTLYHAGPANRSQAKRFELTLHGAGAATNARSLQYVQTRLAA